MILKDGWQNNTEGLSVEKKLENDLAPISVLSILQS
jgi:hypothetical protein